MNSASMPPATANSNSNSSSNSSSSSNRKKRRRHRPLPLDGVVACLSGLPADEKERWHRTIEALGGRYARDFVLLDGSGSSSTATATTANNSQHGGSRLRPTHLIAAAARGAKFQAAVQWLRHQHRAANSGTSGCDETTTTTALHVVSPRWLAACARAQRRVPERDHDWLDAAPSAAAAEQQRASAAEEGGRQKEKDGERPGEPSMLLSETALHDLLHNTDDDLLDRNWFLFSQCHFYFMGHDTEVMENNDNNATMTTLSLQRLIRRGLGTLHWNAAAAAAAGSITHVVVVAAPGKQPLDRVRCAAQFAQPKPAFVSPQWVVDSYRAGSLQGTTQYDPPQFRMAPTKNEQGQSSNTMMSTGNSNKHHPQKQPQQQQPPPALFRGAVFAVARTAPPPGAVDWDSRALRDLAAARGGTLLTRELLGALQKDHGAAAENRGPKPSKQQQRQQRRRICYAVRWGGSSAAAQDGNRDQGDDDDDDALHPLLQRAKQICRVENVTPLWLQTCATEGRFIEPNRFPRLFRPHANNRALRSFLGGSSSSSNSQKAATVVREPPRISVTGFRSGAHRTALRHLIEAMGGVYEDALRRGTTHLVVNVGSNSNSNSDDDMDDDGMDGSSATGIGGPKYETAVQWNLHIVTADWLHHVAEHGWNNVPSSTAKSKTKTKDGERSEDRFAVPPPSALEDEEDSILKNAKQCVD